MSDRKWTSISDDREARIVSFAGDYREIHVRDKHDHRLQIGLAPKSLANIMDMATRSGILPESPIPLSALDELPDGVEIKRNGKCWNVSGLGDRDGMWGSLEALVVDVREKPQGPHSNTRINA